MRPLIGHCEAPGFRLHFMNRARCLSGVNFTCTHLELDQPHEIRWLELFRHLGVTEETAKFFNIMGHESQGKAAIKQEKNKYHHQGREEHEV